MNVNRLIIEPFNTWWRGRGGHCKPNPLAVEAFNAGFRAAMELQEIRRKDVSHLHWCAYRIGKDCNCRVPQSDANVEPLF